MRLITTIHLPDYLYFWFVFLLFFPLALEIKDVSQLTVLGIILETDI